MTAVLENRQRAEAISYPAVADTIASIKTTFADLWPPVMIVFGIFLTLLWGGGLAWLFLRTILAVI